MNRGIVCLLTVAGLAADFAALAAQESDHKAIQGTWKLVSAIHDGEKSKLDGGDRVLAISSSHVIYSFEYREEYELRPDKNPKWIDILEAPEGEKSQRIPGIYELAGDSLTICYHPKGKDRPAKFQNEAGSGLSLLTYKRLSKEVKAFAESKRTFGDRVTPSFTKPKDDDPAITISSSVDTDTSLASGPLIQESSILS